MQLALGFGDHKFIQADFLFPAVLEMSRRATFPVTPIPSSRPRRRPILFNSRATDHLMHNLDYFALRHGLSQSIAQEIAMKYKVNLSGVIGGQKDRNLGAIAFF
jgi:hypothetical protein